MQKLAKELAIKNAIEKLKNIDIVKRCKSLNICLSKNNHADLRLFEKKLEFDINNFNILDENKKEISLNEQILIYHYLLNEYIPDNKNNLISFKEIQSGGFYIEPFRKRTIIPLVTKIVNNLNKLIENLDKNFIWEKVKLGDFGAKINAIEDTYIIIVYYFADSEFEPDAQILFDESLKYIFCPEDIVVLSSIICFRLMQ